jgi:cytochrome P450
MLSNIYSKSAISSSPYLQSQTTRVLHGRFLPLLRSARKTAQVAGHPAGTINIIPVLNAVTMDIVTAYIFGISASSNLLRSPEELTWFLDLYNSRRSFNFWPQEFPHLTAWLKKWLGYRLVPRWVDDANAEIERWTMRMCESAAGVLEQQQGEISFEDTPSVYRQLSAALAKEKAKKEAPDSSASSDTDDETKFAIASELLDHLAAGFDTSSITLTYIIHELSTHPDVQRRLQRELIALSASSATEMPPSKAIDAMPMLHAIIQETLRLHPAIPGPQPRVTPPQGCKLGNNEMSAIGGGGEYYIPGGVRVSASAGLLHTTEHIYPRAEEWLPDRWLALQRMSEDERKNMESRWFWAFGRSVPLPFTSCSEHYNNLEIQRRPYVRGKPLGHVP